MKTYRQDFIPYKDYIMKNVQNSDFLFLGNIYILTDAYTFSSAMDFAQIIQDNQMGIVIGETSSNNANGYGEVVLFKLKESGLSFQISTKKFYRIDPKKGDFIVPDYECHGEEVFRTLDTLISE